MDKQLTVLDDSSVNVSRFKNTRESILSDTTAVRSALNLTDDYRIILPNEQIQSSILDRMSANSPDTSVKYLDIPQFMEHGFNVEVFKKRERDSLRPTYMRDIRANGGVWNVTYKSSNFYGFISYHCIDRVEYTFEIWLVQENEINVFADFMIEYQKFNRELNATHKVVTVYGGNNYNVDNLSYDWDDLIIDPKTKTSIKESVDFWFKNEPWYRDRKFPYKRGILIHGYPGNGKTFMTKIIISLYDLSIVQFNFGNANVSNNDLMDAFRDAKENAPSLFLLEDVDRIFSDFEKGATRVTKDCLFNCLDGIEELDGVLVIATANHVEDLDTAFINRPSRFDTIIRLDNPTLDLRVEYLEKLFKKDFDDKAVLRDVASRCETMSMAFMKEIYFKSVINSLNNGSNVTAQNIYDALDDCIRHFTIAKTAKSENEAGFRSRKAGFGNGVDVEKPKGASPRL